MRPILFEVSGFTLFAYPLFMGLSWGLAFTLTRHLFEERSLNTKELNWLFISQFISTWIGAKVFFLLFSSQENFNQYLYADNFWLGGGFVFYGGLIFGLISFLLLSLVFKKFSFSHTVLLAPGLAFGHAVGRVGCFLTGCCYGSQCDLFFAVKMHDEYRHAVQLYEAAGLFALGMLSLRWIKTKKDNIFVLTHYLLYYAVLRFIVEFYRGDTIRGLHWFSLSTSQWVSIIIAALSLLAIILQKQNTDKALKNGQ